MGCEITSTKNLSSHLVDFLCAAAPGLQLTLEKRTVRNKQQTDVRIFRLCAYGKGLMHNTIMEWHLTLQADTTIHTRERAILPVRARLVPGALAASEPVVVLQNTAIAAGNQRVCNGLCQPRASSKHVHPFWIAELGLAHVVRSSSSDLTI